MATIIQSLMVQSQIPYALYGLGALCAFVLEMLGVSPLAFALGMYLPIQINMPLLAGGLVSHFVLHASGAGNQKMGSEESPKEKGTLIASGFIAGGALMGVIGAVMNLNEIGKPVRFLSIGSRYVREIVEGTGKVIWNIPETGGHPAWFEALPGQLTSLCGFLILAGFCYFYSVRKKK